MKKQIIILGILLLVLLISGNVCLYMTVNARDNYKNAASTVALAGDNYKAQQKANDDSMHLEELRNKWMSYRIAAFVCYALSVVFSVAILIIAIRLKHVRE